MSTAAKPIPPSLNGWSAEYVEQQYAQFRRDPSGVTPDVRAFFAGFELAMAGELKLFGRGGAAGVATPPASTNGAAHAVPHTAGALSNGAGLARRGAPGTPVRITPGRGQPAGRATDLFQAVVDDLIDEYRDQGHLAAQIDPFGRGRAEPESLTLNFHHLGEADLDHPVDGQGLGLSGQVPLRAVIDRLRATYCGSIGAEFMHITDAERRAWLFERFERSAGRLELTRGERAHILELLIRSEMFERFLGKRYQGEKRFSLEGSESLIPLLDRLITAAADHHVEEVVLGMAHRGRLNVLNNVLGKSYEQIFTEFEETWTTDFQGGGGDVKYHRGYSGTKMLAGGRMIHLAMASNPSHLEAVAAVVLGRCRAKQRLRADTQTRGRVIPIVIHGDAAVAGQGIVQEIANFSELEGYRVGGCVHVVVNNQIGFTTVPEDGRSSRYCTDIGKAIDAPIFHVNGEDPEAVVAVAQMAMEYRQQFKKDVWIDLQCYRKYGHNEQDEMSFTQPLLAELVRQKSSDDQRVLATYSRRLLEEQVINQADMETIQIRLDEALEKAQQMARQAPKDPTIDPGSARWSGFGGKFSFEPGATAVSVEMLREAAEGLGRVPDGFTVNKKLQPLMTSRAKLWQSEEIGHADGEMLAFGTLLLEGYPLRLSGQDCRRGTFSQRHAVLRDAGSGQPFTPLNHMREMGTHGTDTPPGTSGADGKPRQAKLCVYDSPLSEFGVMGFDYGYSLADPNMLVMWEGQFGDFVNGAQVLLDQFVTSAEQKWERWSGFTILLPHGYEGQGPEHSSGRMERFLQSCAGENGAENIQVCVPTTGAQMFHLIRRQMKRSFRKPLVVFTPKSMLRTPTSTWRELVGGQFHELIDDPAFAAGGQDRAKVSRVVVCSGKIYHELADRRAKLGRKDVAIVRAEQLFPFHVELFKKIRGQYPKGAEVVYVQEEPRNMGGYLFVADVLETKAGTGRPGYIGRPAAASPAVGSKKVHKKEQEMILAAAIGPLPEGEKH